MNNNDPFSQLWQQQHTNKVDVAVLKKQWKGTRIKQWAYFLLDLICTLILPVMTYILYPKLNRVELVWVVSMGMLCVVVFAYLVWLRRYSLGFGKDKMNLSSYRELLAAQYQQSIKIARLSKLSTWSMPLLMFSFWGVSYFTQALEPEAALRKLKFLAIWTAVFMPLIWIWAHKREQKFTRALASLETVES